MDFRARVVDHYRSRGYQVRDSARVRGRSGNVYAVDLVAQGPLGNIVLTFGGTDGVDEADVAHIKRVAKEVGATPVAAAERFDPVVRRLAARESVVVLDHGLPDQVQEPDIVPDDDVKRWAEDHPWPDAKKERAAPDALDDLLAPQARSSAAPAPAGPAPTPTTPTSTTPTSATPTQTTATQPASTASMPAPSPSGRFAWLSPDQAAPASTGPAATTDATTAAFAPTGTEPSTTRPAPAAQPAPVSPEISRDELLRRARERVDVSHAPSAPGAPGAASSLPARVSELVWIGRFAAGGAAAGAVLWLLLRFT